MYVRFVVAKRDQNSCLAQGIIQAAYDLRDAGQFSPEEEARFLWIRWWFNNYLPVPNRFSRSDRKCRAGRAVCWFKDGATNAIYHARALAYLLEEHGQPVQVLLCHRPGYVVYEDALQVVAEPFRPELRHVLQRC